MRRISVRPTLMGVALGALLATDPALAQEGPWRSLVGMPEQPERVRPLDRFVIAWQRHDEATVRTVLEDEGWSPHLRHWARARWLVERGEAAAAL